MIQTVEDDFMILHFHALTLDYPSKLILISLDFISSISSLFIDEKN